MMSDRARSCYNRFQDNVSLATRLEVKLPSDMAWSSVVRFYAAVHLMNAYLIDRSHLHFDPASAEHTERKRAMDRCPELRSAPKHYRQIKDISEAIRYDSGFQYRAEHHKIVVDCLARITAIVEPKIATV